MALRSEVEYPISMFDPFVDILDDFAFWRYRSTTNVYRSNNDSYRPIAEDYRPDRSRDRSRVKDTYRGSQYGKDSLRRCRIRSLARNINRHNRHRDEVPRPTSAPELRVFKAPIQAGSNEQALAKKSRKIQKKTSAFDLDEFDGIQYRYHRETVNRSHMRGESSER